MAWIPVCIEFQKHTASSFVSIQCLVIVLGKWNRYYRGQCERPTTSSTPFDTPSHLKRGARLIDSALMSIFSWEGMQTRHKKHHFAVQDDFHVLQSLSHWSQVTMRGDKAELLDNGLRRRCRRNRDVTQNRDQVDIHKMDRFRVGEVGESIIRTARGYRRGGNLNYTKGSIGNYRMSACLSKRVSTR